MSATASLPRTHQRFIIDRLVCWPTRDDRDAPPGYSRHLAPSWTSTWPGGSRTGRAGTRAGPGTGGPEAIRPYSAQWSSRPRRGCGCGPVPRAEPPRACAGICRASLPQPAGRPADGTAARAGAGPSRRPRGRSLRTQTARRRGMAGYRRFRGSSPPKGCLAAGRPPGARRAGLPTPKCSAATARGHFRSLSELFPAR